MWVGGTLTTSEGERSKGQEETGTVTQAGGIGRDAKEATAFPIENRPLIMHDSPVK